MLNVWSLLSCERVFIIYVFESSLHALHMEIFRGKYTCVWNFEIYITYIKSKMDGWRNRAVDRYMINKNSEMWIVELRSGHGEIYCKIQLLCVYENFCNSVLGGEKDRFLSCRILTLIKPRFWNELPLKKKFFICLHRVFVVACGIFGLCCCLRTLSYGMWDLAPPLGIEPRPPSLGAWNLRHWTTREVGEWINY